MLNHFLQEIQTNKTANPTTVLLLCSASHDWPKLGRSECTVRQMTERIRWIGDTVIRRLRETPAPHCLGQKPAKEQNSCRKCTASLNQDQNISSAHIKLCGLATCLKNIEKHHRASIIFHKGHMGRGCHVIIRHMEG